MKISYTYRGKETVHCQDFDIGICGENGSVVIYQEKWTDGVEKLHKVHIEPCELLAVAKRCVSEINKIADTQYKIYNMDLRQ